MDSKERVLAAIRHKETDRIPITFDAEKEVYAALYDHLGVDTKEALFDRLCVDTWMILPGNFVYPVEENDKNEKTSIWGYKTRVAKYSGGTYDEVCFNPLAGKDRIADIKALDVDIAHGGMEQRKIHMLARELLPEIGHEKPVCIHTPLLCSLQGPDTKMSSSMPETMIKVEEKPEEIKAKISKAYCPPEKEGNPILQICELILFPKFGKIEIKRPEKFGGDIESNSYSELEKTYLAKNLHAADLKNSVAEALIELLEPVRG